MAENEIGREVVDAAVEVHSPLGPGLLESVYEVVLAKELVRRGLTAWRQVLIGVGRASRRERVPAVAM